MELLKLLHYAWLYIGKGCILTSSFFKWRLVPQMGQKLTTVIQKLYIDVCFLDRSTDYFAESLP